MRKWQLTAGPVFFVKICGFLLCGFTGLKPLDLGGWSQEAWHRHHRASYLGALWKRRQFVRLRVSQHREWPRVEGRTRHPDHMNSERLESRSKSIRALKNHQR